jgi:hypothetical protein
MEYLPCDMGEILRKSKQDWASFKYASDELRMLAIEAFYALNVLHTHGFMHGDIKPDNLRLRYYPDGSYVVVFIDGGCSRNLRATRYRYDKYTRANVVTLEKDLGRFTSASPRVPPQTTRLRAFGLIDRPGTPGYQIDPRHPAHSIQQLQGTDVHALAIIFLSVTGKEPGRSAEDAEKFQKRIYQIVEEENIQRFFNDITGYKAGLTGGGFDPTGVRWLQLIFQALCPCNRISAARALESNALLCPNLDKELVPRLTTTGIVAYGYSPDLKPVAVFLEEDGSLAVYCLLNCCDNECIAHYEERHVPGRGDPALGHGFLRGSFVQHNQITGKAFGRIGAYLERSGQHCSADGSVRLPDRSAWQTMSGQDPGEAKEAKRYIPMFSNGKLAWGARLTCGWSSAGMAQTEHTQALLLLRSLVLAEGHVDSWQPEAVQLHKPAPPHEPDCLGSTVQGSSRPEGSNQRASDEAGCFIPIGTSASQPDTDRNRHAVSDLILHRTPFLHQGWGAGCHKRRGILMAAGGQRKPRTGLHQVGQGLGCRARDTGQPD